MLAFVSSQSATMTADLTPPSGWVKAGWSFTATSNSIRHNSLWVKRVGSGEPSSHTWTGILPSGQRSLGAVLLVRGANPTAPVLASSAETTAANNLLPIIPALSGGKQNCLAVGMIHLTAASPNNPDTTVPAPWTRVVAHTTPTPWSTGPSHDGQYIWTWSMGAATSFAQAVGTVAGSTVIAADSSASIIIQP
jgi:hypothetical protein